MAKRKKLNAIKLPLNWETTVEEFVRKSTRHAPERRKVAMRILRAKPTPEGRGEDACDSFAKEALREFILAGATVSFSW